ncbi:MAG: prepilin-type N-terminal cleavage/methylation domain-containing protein [Armatimonadetes bacterium]|nr:MAG: prepilin-type N-terminal cleavage/methylation domain-containing protein [Armatimonadota bacterium]
MKNIIKTQTKGFTLVELMVVISIVAVLATIGFTLFQNTQASARDAKRRLDVDAMANTLETRFDATTGTYQTSLVADWFSDKTVPVDPLNNGSYQYLTHQTLSATEFKICALLEKGGGNFSDAGTTPVSGGDYYCKLSQQK